MITTLNHWKLLETLKDEKLLKIIKDLNFSTEKIFGKFGTTNMCNGNEFYNSVPSGSFNLDKAIDELPIENVPIELVYPTQRSISYDSFLDKLSGKPKNENDLPFMIHNNLGYFIFDGHHRCALAKLRGDKFIKSKVFTESKINESINYSIDFENWQHDNKIIIRNEESPNQKLVSMLAYQIDKSKSEIYIESITTMPFYKKMGFAKLMFDKLLEIAKKKKIKTIRLNASPLRKDVNLNILINMYQKWGFKIINQDSKSAEMIYIL